MKYNSLDQVMSVDKLDYSKKIIFDSDDFIQSGHLLQVVTIPPRTKQRIHFHNKQTEVFYVLKGKALLTINEVEYPTKEGDSFICSPGDKHNLWNKSDEKYEILVFKIDFQKDNEDTEWEK
jgi:quercetin dioxygenase-like cupin family protein